MRAEEQKLIETLFLQHWQALFIHAYGYLKNRDDAEVAVQEAFRIACKKVQTLSKSPNQIGWLKMTVKYVCANMITKRQRQLQLLIPLCEISNEAAFTQPEQLTRASLEELEGVLSKQELDLIWQIIVEGRSYREVAQALGISVWACRKRVQRATVKLRKHFEQ